jgi:DNA repair protein RadC
MQPIMGSTHEEFWIVYLNNSIKFYQKRFVDVRIVFKSALEMGTTGLIYVTIIPGTLVPSDADKQITKIKISSDSLEIKVLDHLIITETNYFSFVDEVFLK